jgi:hypothetical protein
LRHPAGSHPLLFWIGAVDRLRPSADSAIVYLYSMAFMGIVAYILVYLMGSAVGRVGLARL